MPRERREHCFISILVAIDKIRRNIQGLSFDQFVEDEWSFSAVSRELQLIGESIKKLSLKPSLLENTAINKKGIIGFINLVVHEYFSIDPAIVFEVATDETVILEKDILDLLQRTVDKQYIFQAIEDSKKALEEIRRHKSIERLEEIKAKLLE